VQSFFGQPRPGSNLWKVSLKGKQWGAPVWLGADLNQSAFTDFPDLAADNSLYFIRPENGMHTFRSQYQNGRYLRPVEVMLGDPSVTTHDPAIAPDESFLVIDYGKTKGGLGRLCIAVREGDHWGKLTDLGDAINSDSPAGARLAPDGHTLYFSGATHIWKLSLAPWLVTPK
jgi:hypothetical protein